MKKYSFNEEINKQKSVFKEANIFKYSKSRELYNLLQHLKSEVEKEGGTVEDYAGTVIAFLIDTGVKKSQIVDSMKWYK